MYNDDHKFMSDFEMNEQDAGNFDMDGNDDQPFDDFAAKLEADPEYHEWLDGLK